ncbi:MAG TPA: hypothetical protein VFN88_02980, partial [Caulobacteraceae bacterium]|nr:hypothetical protein [Caulobacteraceae bacterium]
QRFRFAGGEWRGPSPAAAGDEVDFESRDGAAADVYVVKGAAGGGDAAVDLGAVGAQARELLQGASASPGVAKALGILKSSIRAQLAVVILVASLLLTFVSVQNPISVFDGGRSSGKYSIVTIGSLVDSTKALIATAAAGADQAAAAMGALGGSPFGLSPQDAASQQQAVSKMKSQANSLHAAAAALNLAYLLYLIPLGALALLVQAFRGKSTALLALVTGGLSAASFLAIVIAKSAVAGVFKELDRGLGAQVANNLIHFGLGSWVLLLAGAAMLAFALGLVKAKAIAA